MKNKFYTILLSVLLPTLVTIGDNSFVNCRKKSAFAESVNEISAEGLTSEILMERDSLRVLSAKNERIKRGIASTTKILTAICVIENCDLDKQVTVTDEMTRTEGSSIYLKAGESRSVEELLYGLMLRSGNDAALALAVAASGNVEKFVALMNDKARAIGAFDSNFANPHGLDDNDHYSTAYDLALITAYALKNETFAKIADTESIKFKTNEGGRYFVNKNKLLKKDGSFNGVKTGYTKKCGRCLVASRTVNGMQLIAVVLNCGPMFERCSELLSYGFDNYERATVLDREKVYGEATYYKAESGSVGVSVKDNVVLPLTEKEKQSISYETFIANDCVSFLKPDMPIGKINVFIGKELIFSAELFIINK